MADILFTLERDGYDTIVLDSDGGGPYGFQKRTQGLGVGPIIPRVREGGGDGVEYDGDKVGAKAIDLGLIIFGDDRLDTGALIRSLRNLLRWRANQPLPKLVASWANGDVLETPVVYSSGLEHDYTKALPTVYEAVVAVSNPDPFWTARNALQFAFENAGSATPFLDDLANLPVASSLIGGSITAPNPGDVDADLAVAVTGPSSGSTTFLVDGVGWVFEASLAAGEVINVVRTPRAITVKDQTGANRYADMGPAPKFPRLPPGDSTISATMVGATSASSVRGFWRPRYEGVY